MLVELLEKFEDVFKPLSKKNVTDRIPEYIVTVTELISKRFEEEPKQYTIKMSGLPPVWNYSFVYHAFNDYIMRRWNISAYQIRDYKIKTILNLRDHYIGEINIEGKRYRIGTRMKD